MQVIPEEALAAIRMPRFEDGCINLQELYATRRVGGQRDHGCRGRPDVRGAEEQQERLPEEEAQDLRGASRADGPEAKER